MTILFFQVQNRPVHGGCGSQEVQVYSVFLHIKNRPVHGVCGSQEVQVYSVFLHIKNRPVHSHSGSHKVHVHSIILVFLQIEILYYTAVAVYMKYRCTQSPWCVSPCQAQNLSAKFFYSVFRRRYCCNLCFLPLPFSILYVCVCVCVFVCAHVQDRERGGVP